MPKKNNHWTNEQFLNSVEQTITVHAMFDPGDFVLVAVSGGPDSVALLDALHLLSSLFSIHLGVAHLNHGLRGDASERDAEFVSGLAETYHLPFHMEKKDVAAYRKKNRLSTEDAARKVRYDFLRKIRKTEGYHRIATAHHADDNAELILMNMIRGSGTKGLEGIPPKREDSIVRPLIRCYRADILDYLSQRKLNYVIDATNADKRFTRNRIRLDLIPLLCTFNPQIGKTLNRLGTIIRNEEVWIQSIVDREMADIVLRQTDQSVDLCAVKFNSRPLALKQRLIRQAILNIKGDLKRISLDHIEAIIRLENAGRIHLPDRILFEKKPERLCFKRESIDLRSLEKKQAADEEMSFLYKVPTPESSPLTLCIKETGVRLRFTQIDKEAVADYSDAGQTVAFFDMGQIVFPLCVRNVNPGDRFVPFGMAGTQKVKNFFINNKIPRSERKKCPVLLSREDIIWLAGFRVTDFHKITDATKRVLKVELLLA